METCCRSAWRLAVMNEWSVYIALSVGWIALLWRIFRDVKD